VLSGACATNLGVPVIVPGFGTLLRIVTLRLKPSQLIASLISIHGTNQHSDVHGAPSCVLDSLDRLEQGGIRLKHDRQYYPRTVAIAIGAATLIYRLAGGRVGFITVKTSSLKSRCSFSSFAMTSLAL
jgi:hypothetical protein